MLTEPTQLSQTLLLVIALAPLLGAALAGLFGRQIGRKGAHSTTIALVALSCGLSIYVLGQFLYESALPFNQNLYTFFESGRFSAHVGFMVDRLTAMMMVVVTFVSLLVHVYTIGYMQDDPGYQRFFSYISLFTFSMLMLVMRPCVMLFRVQLLLHWVHHGPMLLTRLTTYRVLYQVLQLLKIARLLREPFFGMAFFVLCRNYYLICKN